MKAAEVAKEALERGVSIRELVREKRLLSEREIEETLDPSGLVDASE